VGEKFICNLFPVGSNLARKTFATSLSAFSPHIEAISTLSKVGRKHLRDLAKDLMGCGCIYIGAQVHGSLFANVAEREICSHAQTEFRHRTLDAVPIPYHHGTTQQQHNSR
jgi:hypothetical protein